MIKNNNSKAQALGRGMFFVDGHFVYAFLDIPVWLSHE